MKSFQSDGRTMDGEAPCFIIGEAGVNHNGDIGLALELVRAAHACGADAVKFQTFTADNLVRAGTETAAYQQAGCGETDQHAMLRRLELSADMHRALLAEVRTLAGFEFLSTPFDSRAADFLVGLGMKRIKVPSGEVTNHPFLAHLAEKDLPLLLSTGMCTLKEVVEAVEVIRSVRLRCGYPAPLASILTVLHCTSNYPTAVEDVNLRAMQTLQRHLQLPVGYSDHTLGTSVAVAAVALGASVIEKHFTLGRDLPGPDHRASLEPDEFARMVREIREIERALGDGVKAPRPSELPVRRLVRRSAVAARDLPTGHLLTAADVSLLRPGTGICPRDLPRLLGRRLVRAVPAGAVLDWSDLAR